MNNEEPNTLVLFAIGFSVFLTFVGVVWGIPALIEHLRDAHAERARERERMKSAARRRTLRPRSRVVPQDQPRRPDFARPQRAERVERAQRPELALRPQAAQERPTRSQEPPKAPPRMTLHQWLNLLNLRLDDVPHTFVEGGSGAGKTTFVKALLSDRDDQLAIVGVKPDDGWGSGYVYHSSQREQALADLVHEVNRRLDDNDRSGLTIVLDDFTRLTAHAPAVELYKLVADIGRSLRIRLILIARGRLVRGLGASGESDLREHFVFVTLRRGHQATLEYDETRYELETSQVRELAARPIRADRWWKRPAPKPVEQPTEATPQPATALPAAPAPQPATVTRLDDARRDREQLLSAFFEREAPVASAAGAQPAPETAAREPEISPASETSFQAQESEVPVSEPAFSVEDIARIVAMIASGKRKTEILKTMPAYSGRKHSLYSAYYDRLYAAFASVVPQQGEVAREAA